MQPGTLHATHGGVWVADTELPVAAFVDSRDLAVTLAGNWLDQIRDRPWSARPAVVTALSGSDIECWIAAPETGGVVRLSNDGGSSSGKFVMRLPTGVRKLACARESCWALLDPGVKPSEQRLWNIREAGIKPFRIRNATAVDLAGGGDNPVFVLVRQLRQGGLSAGRGILSVLQVFEDGDSSLIAEVDQPGVSRMALYADRYGPWLEINPAASGPEARRRMERLGVTPGNLSRLSSAVLPKRAFTISVDANTIWIIYYPDVRREIISVRNFDYPSAIMRIGLGQDDAESRILELPGRARMLTACEGVAWCSATQRMPVLEGSPARSLLRLRAAVEGGLELAQVGSWPDLTTLTRSVGSPTETDAIAWVTAQRDELLGELGPGAGYGGEYIRDAEIDSVMIVGSYPATELVVRFHVRQRPHTDFARALRCFDDLGAPRSCLYEGLQLKEDIETGALPPPGRDFADSEGIVWV